MTPDPHGRPPVPKTRRSAFLGLCKEELAAPTTVATATTWGVVLLSEGRLSYLQHGLIQPDLDAEEVALGLVSAYGPAGVATVGNHPAVSRHLPVACYGMAELLRTFTPRSPCEPFLHDTLTHLLDLPVVPEPPAASFALAAAVVYALRATNHAIGRGVATTVVPLPPRSPAANAPQYLAELRAFPF